MKLTQCDTILIAMLENEWKTEWDARDFQGAGKYFVGYEATARISDLIRKYPELFIVGKDGRFRTIAINWDNKQAVKEAKEYLSLFQQQNNI